MPVFMVDRNLKGVSLDQLGEAKEAAISQAAAMRDVGRQVRYIRSTFLPEEGRCMCLFEAETEADVKELNKTAGIPYQRIVPAYDLTP